VNLTGLKKRSSNAERLQFAEEIIPHALQSAEAPLEVEVNKSSLFHFQLRLSRNEHSGGHSIKFKILLKTVCSSHGLVDVDCGV